MRYVDTLSWFDKFIIISLFIQGGIYRDMYSGTIGDWWFWRLCSIIAYASYSVYLYKILWDKNAKNS